MPNDDRMTGPGAHEQVAHQEATNGDTASATVYAILALAAAVNRLADAQQARTDLEMDRTYPRKRFGTSARTATPELKPGRPTLVQVFALLIAAIRPQIVGGL